MDEAAILTARRAILEAAQDMLAGKLSYIEGSRKILFVRNAAKLDEWDPDLVPFLGIHSETDSVPLGEARAYWQEAALKALEAEIAKKELWAKQFGEAHCRNLIERFSKLGRLEN